MKASGIRRSFIKAKLVQSVKLHDLRSDWLNMSSAFSNKPSSTQNMRTLLLFLILSIKAEAEERLLLDLNKVSASSST